MNKTCKKKQMQVVHIIMSKLHKLYKSSTNKKKTIRLVK